MSTGIEILLVEDSEPDALLIERALRQAEWELRVQRVAGKVDYLSALERSWDIILCDHTLPDMDAPEALEMAVSAGGDIPFVVVSGTIDEETVVGILKAGASDYVMKSNLRRLVPVIELALARASERRTWRRAEARVRLLSQAIEQGGSLVVITDATGRIEYVNPRFCQVSGYPLEALRGQTPSLVKGDTPAATHRELWAAITAGQVWRGELGNRARDGSAYRVTTTISPVRDEAGAITHFVGIQEDITADVRRRRVAAAVDTVRRAIWLMRRPEDMADLRAAVERAVRAAGIPFRAMSINIIESDTQARSQLVGTRDGEDLTPRLSVGQGNQLIRGWVEAGQVVSRPDLQSDDPFDERRYIDETCGYPVRAVVDVPFSHGTLAVNSDLPGVYDDDHIDCLRQMAGVLSEAFTRLDDLCRLEEQEQQLRQSQKMEAVGQLAGGVAHDFNNLLTVIKGYTQVLQRRLQGKEAEQLAQIGRAADSAATLVRQLLAFGRRQVMEPQSVALNQVVADMQKMLGRLLGEHVDLRVELAEDACPVRADPGQLEQVVVNLAVNARDAMPDGGRLTVRTERVVLDAAYADRRGEVPQGIYALLAVTDTGTGMDAATQARIFEPFFTTKAQGRGTGLGLATVYGIVKQSDGYIWVYSEPGHGTTFKIYLPLATPQAAVEDAASTGAAPAGAAPTGGGPATILLVEDEDMVRQLAQLTLEEDGYRVIAAASGAEALEAAAREDRLDLLVTDLVMPGMNGIELGRRLRDLRPVLPVLYTSGYLDQRSLGGDALSGDEPFLAKPYDPQTLKAKVRQVLDGQEAGDATA